MAILLAGLSALLYGGADFYGGDKGEAGIRFNGFKRGNNAFNRIVVGKGNIF